MTLLKSISTIFLALFFLASIACNKNSATVLPPNRFTWTYIGANHTASQFSAFLYSRGDHVITAAQGNTLSSFPRCEFSLSSFNVNTYPFNSSGINIFRYVDDAGNVLEATAGGISITAYGNDLMSGSFSATLTNSSGGTLPISGTFSNVPVVP